MKNIYIFTILTFFSLWAWGQSDGDYQSAGTGNWSDAGTWQVYNSGWEAAADAPDGSSDITILNGHTVTIAGGTTVTISSEKVLKVESGGALSITAAVAFPPQAGGSLSVSGTLRSEDGSITSTSNELTINDGGIYEHYFSSSLGTVPAATWNTGSTTKILGGTGTGSISGLSQSFYNFIYDNSLQNNTIYLTGLTDVNGDFTFNSSNSKYTYLVNGESVTVNIDGDFSVSNSSTYLFLCNTGALTLNILGNLSYTNGAVSGFAINNTGSVTVNIDGNFTMNSSGGTMYHSFSADAAEINIDGDFSVTAGTITAGGTSLINLSGSSLQNISFSGTIDSNVDVVIKSNSSTALSSNFTNLNGSLTVENNASIDCSTYVCSGSGDFTVSSGATIKSANATGLDGSVDCTGTETFDDEANYTFNGSVAQTTGSSIPSPVNDLTIDNTSGVTLSKNIAINGALDVSGLLNASTYVLSDGGTGTATFNDGAILKTGHASGVTGSITIAAPSFTNTAVEYNGSIAQSTGLSGITGITGITVNNGTNGVTLDNNISGFTGTFTVNGSCILDVDEYTVEGTGSISFGSGATLKMAGSAGVNQLNLSGGQTFDVNNKFEFNSSSGDQEFGSYMPSTVGKITINNTGTGKVYMNADQTVTTSNLVVSSGWLEIVTSSGLTLDGPTSLSGTNPIIIKSSSTGQGSLINNGTITYNGSDIKIERDLSAERTWYFSSPIQNLPWDVFEGAEQVKQWNANDSIWEDVTAGTFEVARGYIMRVQTGGTSQLAGQIYDANSYAKSWTHGGYGWYLAGNPYPSALNAADVYVNNSVRKSFWVNNNGSYKIYTEVDGDGTTNLPGSVIPPHQSFWINADDASPSITIEKNDRTHGGANSMLLKNNSPSSLTKIQLHIMRDSVYNDDIFVLLLDSASGSYDDYDMQKKMATNADFPQIYTITDDSKNCIVDVRSTFSTDTSITIPLGFYNAFNEDTISIHAADVQNVYDYQTIWMVDSVTEDSIDILNQDYEFVADSGLTENRFYLHFGTESSAPVIMNQSTTKNLCLGETTELYVTAGGVPSPTYQWYGPDGIITDETNNILNLENTTQDQAGTYYCEVSNTGGTTQTDNIIVNVGTTPAFTNLTGDIETCAGTEINIAATVEANTYSPNKKWFFNGNELTEVGSGDIENSSASIQDEGYYYCEISNICGTVNSDSVYVDIKEAPEVSNEYANDQVCEGTDVAYTITGTGEGTITYQWYKGENAITGEETETLNLTQIDLTAAGTYNCQVSNECGSVTSSNFILSVSEKPTVNMFNEEQHLCESTNTQLSANVTGVGSIDYTWYKDDVEVGNTEDLAFASVATADEGMYKLVVSDACGSDSAYTNLVVDAQLELTINNTDVTLCTGENLLLDATSNDNTGSVNYMWYRDNYSVASGLLTHNIENANLNDAGDYYLIGTNACGMASTDTVMVEVNQTPIVELGDDIEIEQGNDTTLDAGVGNADYEWSTDEYTQIITVSDAGTYHVTVTKDGCAASDSVVVDVITDINTINNSFGIYPNPADKFLTIQTGLDNYTYSIYTIEGKLVLQENAQGNTTLNIEELSPGLYTLELKYKNNIIKEKLIIE